MTAVQDQITALIAKVQAENTVIGSAMALITGLKAQIVTLQAGSPPVVIDPATLQALSDAIDAGAAQLAAAVAANTPTATVTVPVTVTVATPPTTVTSTSS